MPECCDGRDRFAANTRKQLFNCRVCGAKGNIIQFVRFMDNVDCKTACETLTERDRPRPAPAPAPARPKNDAEYSKYAVGIWYAARAAAGTLVETYLRSRGITIPPPLSLRFAPQLQHRTVTKPIVKSIHPAMVALVTRGTDNTPLGIHRTYLSATGAKPAVDEVKKMLGPVRGGCVRLAAAADGFIAIGEGIETCLSVQQATGLPTWAALSTSGMRSLELPDGIRRITILADADDNGKGEAAARDAGRRWLREGRVVKIARPPPNKDFNNVLQDESAR